MKKHKTSRRWRLMASVPIQGGLVVRLFLYWCLFQFSVFATIALFSFLTNGESSGTSLFWPAMIVSFMILPMVMLDLMRFSNKFAGPIVNISNKMKKMASSETVETINLRPGDFCMDLADHVNQVALKLKKSVDGNAEHSLANHDQSENECHV